MVPWSHVQRALVSLRRLHRGDICKQRKSDLEGFCTPNEQAHERGITSHQPREDEEEEGGSHQEQPARNQPPHFSLELPEGPV